MNDPKEPARERLLRSPPKLALVMVGLPARGKTDIAQKLARYLRWRGHETRVFNVGDYRRRSLGSQHPASFFDPTNREYEGARRAVAEEALHDMLRWLERGQVGIYDATNTTRERRDLVREACRAAGVRPIFIESICNDPEIIEANVWAHKLASPDYAGADPEDAVRDFLERIAVYERAYEPVADESASFIKVIDVGRQVVANRIHGYIPARIVYFLMNIHTQSRTIWFTRHGQSEDNVLGRLGGDSSLSPGGRTYAEALKRLVQERFPSGIEVLTSTLRRATETAQLLDQPYRSWKELDEIDAGICDGMTYDEVAESMPEEFAARQRDKFRYRYPQGESYQDVIRRTDHIIVELERRHDPVLVVAHQAVLRVLYAYFMNRRPEECPFLEIPLHTVLELRPRPYGCDEVRIPL